MRKQQAIALAAVAATATIGTVAAVADGSASAAAANSSHTLRFTSVQTSEKRSGYHFVDADKDVKNGKVIGDDVVNGVYHPKTQTFSLQFAGALVGRGIIYGHGNGNGKTGNFTGKITGGTGKFKGVHGTITGQSTGKKDQNEKLVFVFH